MTPLCQDARELRAVLVTSQEIFGHIVLLPFSNCILYTTIIFNADHKNSKNLFNIIIIIKHIERIICIFC